MRKIILIFSLILALSSCDDIIYDNGKVTKVEKADNTHYYVTIYVKLADRYHHSGEVVIYTTTLYQVGDSIKFTKVKK